MQPEVKALIDHYKFEPQPVEDTLFTTTYRSQMEKPDGGPIGTAIISMYCDEPRSVSCFHRLPWDEIWHFYGGDPLRLVLLHPDGSSEDVIMGSDPLAGQLVQYVIPAHTWQAGHMVKGGRYSLFGNTMAPGFTSAAFEAETAEKLIAGWSDRTEDIRELCCRETVLRMPGDFAT